MNNPYLEKMNELNADGIDFMPVSFLSGKELAPIINSYTKEEFENIDVIPKTGYKYWKLVDGKKEYIEQQKEKI